MVLTDPALQCCAKLLFVEHSVSRTGREFSRSIRRCAWAAGHPLGDTSTQSALLLLTSAAAMSSADGPCMRSWVTMCRAELHGKAKPSQRASPTQTQSALGTNGIPRSVEASN